MEQSNNPPKVPEMTLDGQRTEELTPAQETIKKTNDKITSTEGFIKSLSELPQTDRTVANIAQAQNELAQLIAEKGKQLDAMYMTNDKGAARNVPKTNTSPWDDVYGAN